MFFFCFFICLSLNLGLFFLLNKAFLRFRGRKVRKVEKVIFRFSGFPPPPAPEYSPSSARADSRAAPEYSKTEPPHTLCPCRRASRGRKLIIFRPRLPLRQGHNVWRGSVLETIRDRSAAQNVVKRCVSEVSGWKSEKSGKVVFRFSRVPPGPPTPIIADGLSRK